MRLLQITDLHLSDDNNKNANVCNNQVFLKLTEYLKERINRLNIDYIVITGDISHDGSEKSYHLFFHEMTQLGVPFSFIHGNHDNLDTLNIIGDGIINRMEFDKISDNQWRVLSVDSVVKGEDYGFIGKNILLDLENKLAKLKNHSIALFLHHHLFPVGTPLVDDIKLINSDELLDVCARYKVKFIGTGHAHTLFQRKKGDMLISVSPAVCSQWENGTTSLKYINNSGFSIISFDDNVHTETWFI